MAHCPKCGKLRVRKRKDGKRKCRKCGFLSVLINGIRPNRMGDAPLQKATT